MVLKENLNIRNEFFYSTDIVNLSTEYNFASVNLSVGYYKQHTKHHYLKLNELDKTINKTKEILDYTSNNIDKIQRFKSYKGRNLFNKLYLKLKLLLNKRISLINFKNKKLKYYLHKVYSLILAILIGGGIGLILRGIKELILSFI